MTSPGRCFTTRVQLPWWASHISALCCAPLMVDGQMVQTMSGSQAHSVGVALPCGSCTDMALLTSHLPSCGPLSTRCGSEATHRHLSQLETKRSRRGVRQQKKRALWLRMYLPSVVFRFSHSCRVLHCRVLLLMQDKEQHIIACILHCACRQACVMRATRVKCMRVESELAPFLVLVTSCGVIYMHSIRQTTVVTSCHARKSDTPCDTSKKIAHGYN